MSQRKLPTPEHFYLKLPLYEEVSWNAKDVFEAVELLYFDGTIDSYCVGCGRGSTFTAVRREVPQLLDRDRFNKLAAATIPALSNKIPLPQIQPGLHEQRLVCARQASHVLIYLYHVKSGRGDDNASMQKIGQYPSFADLTLPELSKYKLILSAQSLSELKRGIGLASHDVGIGAYVYLRRVFESLLEEAHQALKKAANWDEAAYSNARVSERIKILKDELPEFLVENPRLYSLLSKGVHELTEQESLEHFDGLRIAIELILDQRLEEKWKQEKIDRAKTALAKSLREVKDHGTDGA